MAKELKEKSKSYQNYIKSGRISTTGFWLTKHGHSTDAGLLKHLVKKFNGTKETLYDFGCGNGSYAKALIDSGVDVECYDGNPNIHETSGGLCKVLDLTSDFNYGVRDWVICLEVGEHVPRKYESKLLDNITKHSSNKVILSWAVPGQGGFGHINCRTNKYIRKQMLQRGFVSAWKVESKLRASITEFAYFKNTMMSFRRK